MGAGVKIWGARDTEGLTWLPVIVDADGNLQVNDTITQYTVLTTDDGSDRVEYVGWALPGTSTSASEWRIAKLSYTAGGNPELKWADGVSTFTKEWDEKGTYTYS